MMHVLENHFILEIALCIIVFLLGWVKLDGGKIIDNMLRVNEKNNSDHTEIYKILSDQTVKITETNRNQEIMLYELGENVKSLKSLSSEFKDRLDKIEPMVYRHEIKLNNIEVFDAEDRINKKAQENIRMIENKHRKIYG